MTENKENAAVEETPKPKKVKKLSKDLTTPGVVKISVEGGSYVDYVFSDLPADIQEKFGPFGLAHKLGDSAAGKKGEDAVNAINAVWKGLMEGNWTTRAPAVPKISISDVKTSLDGMSKEQQKAARALLKAMNFPVPE